MRIFINSFMTLMLLFVFNKAEGAELTKQQIETIIRDYLLNNPEVLIEATNVLREREQERQEREVKLVLSKLNPMLTKSSLDPVGGNPEGSITIVQFMDYTCGFCKRANKQLQQLIAANPDLRVVYKEFPILSDLSEYAARVALAINLLSPNHYAEFHNTLMTTSELTSPLDVWRIVEQLSLDRNEIESRLNAPEVESHLRETRGLTRELNITGTPAFVIGQSIIRGAAPQEDIQNLIDVIKGTTR